MLFDVLILSLIEGVTEFLPISSTGHLILVSDWQQMDPEFSSVFTIAIQLGAMLAVCVLYASYFATRIRHIFSKETQVLVVSILPIIVVGYLMKDIIKSMLFNPITVFTGLIISGVGLVVADAYYPKKGTNDDKSSVTFTQAIIVGCWQCLALWPGMSRSAMSIMGGMSSGLNRVTATAFSFVIALPVMIIVVGYELINARTILSASDYGWIGVGIFMSFCIAMISMRWFLKFVVTNGLRVFGWYRIIIGGIGLVFFV